MKIKELLLFIFCTVGAFIVTLVLLGKKIPEKKTINALPNSTVTETPTIFSTQNAPSQSLRGIMTTFSGDISWESREATEPAVLAAPTEIEQGEKLITGKTGTSTISFQDAVITVLPHTDIDIIQTLPNSLVFQQNDGITRYKKSATIPLAVRSYHLLIDQVTGEMVVSVDKTTGMIIVSAEKGSITVAYNNKKFESQVRTISEGQMLQYDDTTQTDILIPRK